MRTCTGAYVIDSKTVCVRKLASVFATKDMPRSAFTRRRVFDRVVRVPKLV